LISRAKDFKGLTNPRIEGTHMMTELRRIHGEKEGDYMPTRLDKLYCVLTEQNCAYHLVYLILSILAWVYVMLYSLLLIDIIRRSLDLKNVVKSVTNNLN